MYKQIIIVRKDLNMSKGKMSAQVSHASMAFLTNILRRAKSKDEVLNGGYMFNFSMSKPLVDEWIDGSFTKCVLEAKNKHQLYKAMDLAEELGMKDGYEFFPIFDNCSTELEPEEENGTTLTCIGFMPMEDKVIDQIGKKYHLYVG